MPGDEAAVISEQLAAVDAAHDDAVGDDRRTGLREPLRVVDFGRPPHLLAGTGVERHDRRVVGREEHLVLVEREAAGRPGRCQRRGRKLVAILPDQVARGSVDRLHHVSRVGIPGHGLRVVEREAMVEFLDMIIDVRDQVQTLISEGRTLTQVMAARPTAAYHAQWGQEASWTANDFIPIVFYELGGGSLFVR